MPRAKKKVTTGDQPSKADLIRKTASELPKPVRPGDVITALKEHDIEVTPNHVAQVLQASGFRRRRRRRNVRGAGESPASAPASHGLNIDAHVAAKSLVTRVGSVEAAEAAIKVLKRLG
jgi:hypothetical protein